jgi:hypothetical protein
MPTKFEQRNSAAGKMTGSQVAMGVATGKMSAKDVANAMGKNSKPAAPTKPNATKTSGSNVKPSTTKTTATKSMKTQNIPEVTVSVTKKTGTATKPVTPPMKEKGVLDTDVYIVRDPSRDYVYRQVPRGTKGATVLNPSRYEKMKGGIGPMKKG